MNQSEPWIQLYIRTDQRPSLERVVSSTDKELGRLESYRGKAFAPSASHRTFPWSPAVRALTVLLLRSATSDGEEVYLEGEEGTLASTLDYAISKRTNWLLDMFDVRADGEPMVRLLFVRTNPERKREGPVRIRLNSDSWPSSGISVYDHNGVPLKRDEIATLCERIEQDHVSRSKVLSATTAVIAMKAENSTREAANSVGFDSLSASAKYPITYFKTPEDVVKEYSSSLRRRAIDRRFAFVGDGAKDWFDLCDSGQHHFFDVSLNAVKKFAPVVAQHIPKRINSILLHPGNCKKERAFIDEIDKVADQDVYAIEASHAILERCMEELEGTKGKKQFYFGDFTNHEQTRAMFSALKRNSDRPSLVMVLGVYFAALAPGELFFNMRDALAPNDYLLANIRLSRSWNTSEELAQIVNVYEEPLFQRQVMSPLRLASIVPDDGVLDVEAAPDDLVPQLHSIRRYFRFTTDKSTRVGDLHFPFLAGERIYLGKSFLLSAESMRNLLAFYGFEIVAEQITENTGDFLCRLSKP